MRAGGASIVASFFVAAASCTCEESEELAVVIDAYGETIDALAEGTTIDALAREIDGTYRVALPRRTIAHDVGANEPVEIRIDLDRPGQYLVHVAVAGPSGVYVATRCYTVTGVVRDDVLLAGPTDPDLDADADSWPLEETCRERGSDEIGCSGQCPAALATDCDDGDPSTHPGASEVCEDGIDQDCDGAEAPCADTDGDGFTACSLDAPDRSICDCDDSDATINPGMVERSDPADGLCENDVDEDCDGRDPGCDRDGDGMPSCAGELQSCDCDDANPGVFPGASEVPGGACDGLDNNCNGLVDEVSACLGDDLDGDGSPAGEDCDDCGAASAPGRVELACGDGRDEDCSGGDEPCQAGDEDRDGVVGQAAGGSDCDDADASIYPGAPDRCGDGIDSACSGQDTSCDSDADDDQWNAANDCDDEDAAVNPGVVIDRCNGVDDDCDGIFEEDLDPDTGCILLRGEWTTIGFDTDLLHCGGCRHDCNTGCPEGVLCQADRCDGGECSCAAGPSCRGDDGSRCCEGGCADLTADSRNCGACGVVCPEPPCRVAVCDAGECGTEAEPDGTDCGGGRFCCGGECGGECAPGDAQPEECGRCGHRERRCGDDCSWGAWGSCAGEGVCEPGDTEEVECADDSRVLRTCTGECEWGPGCP